MAGQKSRCCDRSVDVERREARQGPHRRRRLLKGFSVNKRIVATAGTGLIPFGKILVGAVMNHTLIDKVLIEFALHDQANIDKLNEDLSKLDKVAQKSQA